MEMEANSWDSWVDQALSRLHSLKLIRSLRPIHLPNPLPTPRDFEVFHHLSPWDRLAIEIKISEPTFLKWVNEIPSSGNQVSELEWSEDESRLSEMIKTSIVHFGTWVLELLTRKPTELCYFLEEMMGQKLYVLNLNLNLNLLRKYKKEEGEWCSRASSEGYRVGLWKVIRRWKESYNRVSFRIGDGKRMKFWMDRWCREDTLVVAFPKLFSIATDKEA
ncbi:hypothetical protein CK203_054665 [Vitis vinifera]|uniref:Reverse transcriptase zinc-binding domain-containing protein n=1 Tax=Vitis vinifera TaxID=29760 RepID=A0A438H8W7_VITVI|nr:hypothetical protein CK203_054665 [Vitis vinifera]